MKFKEKNNKRVNKMKNLRIKIQMLRNILKRISNEAYELHSSTP